MTLLVYNLLTVIANIEDLERDGYLVQSTLGAEDDLDDDEFALDNLGAKLLRLAIIVKK